MKLCDSSTGILVHLMNYLYVQFIFSIEWDKGNDSPVVIQWCYDKLMYINQLLLESTKRTYHRLCLLIAGTVSSSPVPDVQVSVPH